MTHQYFIRTVLLACMTAGPALCDAQSNASRPAGTWPFYGGDAGATKYSPLTQIDRGNVARLERVWTWHVGEAPVTSPTTGKSARPGAFEATPLMIGDTLFFSTSFNRVVAMNAATGKPFWVYDPRAYDAGQPPNGTGFVHRGVASWSNGTSRRIFMNSRWNLIAIDAATGKPVRTFGDTGVVSLIANLRRKVNPLHYTNTSPPVVYKNLVIVGSGVADRLVYKDDPPGDVQAFDVITGKLAWTFHTVPDSSEFGVDTWENGSWRTTGHTNVWAPFSLDAERGLVYLPVSTPSNDWYGGQRKGNNLFAESIVCVDANTGKRRWHYQLVHHGLWDYDPASPPVLGTITVDGKRIDAVSVPTKMGFVFVFDRVTGKPVWPINERPVAASDIPNERASLTQPVPTLPAPFAKQGFSENDVVDFTPAIRKQALEVMSKYRVGPIFTPPSEQGTIVMPGAIGGAGWGGGAFDPETGVIYIKATNNPSLFKVRANRASPGTTIAENYRVDLKHLELGVTLVSDFTTRVGRLFRRASGNAVEQAGDIPLIKPPYGTLTAIDLNTGAHRWQVPLGDTPEVRYHPALRGVTLPPLLGVAGAPGAIVTKGGLLFVTGGGSVLYAIDKSSGKTLWSADLGRRAYSVPMTYQTRTGRQYVVIATGTGSFAELIAFALP